MKLLSSALIIAGAVVSINAQADSLGFSYGRSANVSGYSAFSVEGATQLGDVDNFGVRASAKLSDALAVYGDFGSISWGDLDDDAQAFGGGVVYEIEGLFPEFDTAITAGYHMISFDEVDWDVSSLGLRGIVSGDMPTQGSMPLAWYATAGFERISSEFEFCFFGCVSGETSSTELAFGGGVVAKFGPGEGYVGGEYVDGFSLAAGYRMNF